MKSKSDKPHYLGHRERLRKKFLSNQEHILDYELLEILLFYVFPRKDTKEIAKELLKHFGSMRSVVYATFSDLNKIDNVGKSVGTLLLVIKEILLRMDAEAIRESVIIASSEQVINYYKNIFWDKKQEQLRIMFLNNKNILLSEELLQIGTVNQTAMYPREIIARALEVGASAIIMVHNHPSGDPKPSRQDIAITKQFKEIATKLDIILLDHLIIGKNKNVSLKELGII